MITKLKDFVSFFVVAALLIGIVVGGITGWCAICDYLIKDRQVAFVVSMLGVVIPCLAVGAWGYANQKQNEG
jgi:hypothetical protein